MLRAAHSEESIPLRKGTWTVEEDQRLTSFIQTNGVWNWNSLPKAAGLLRSGKSCRLRWVNYLRPDIKHGNFSKEEVQTILKLHQDMGNRWSQIALRLPGRTDNEIKNFWNSHLKKRQKKRPRNNAMQATEAPKQKNISEENASSLNAPKAPYLEGFEETPVSPEPCALVKFSSASSSSTELDETRTIKEKMAFQEFPGELQGLRNGAGLGNGTSRSDLGYVASSSSALFGGINKDQTAEKNSDSPGLSEELKSIWEQPFLADDFQEKVLLDGSMYPCTFNANDDFWVYPFM